MITRFSAFVMMSIIKLKRCLFALSIASFLSLFVFLYIPVEETRWEPTVLQRRALVRSQCQRFNWTQDISTIRPNQLNHIVVDDEHKLLYCYVPKVSCTHWKSIFFVLTGVKDENGQPYRRIEDIPKAHVPGMLRFLNEYSREEIMERISHYYKVLTVRHPLERTLSAYRDKFDNPNNFFFPSGYGPYIVKRFRAHSNSTFTTGAQLNLTLSEFVQFILDKESASHGGNNEHWQPMYNLCLPCFIDYDVIAKAETMDQDANHYLQSAKVDHLVQFPSLPPGYVRTSFKTVKSDWLAVLKENLSPLYEKYFQDFVLFNYSIPEDLLP